MGVRECVLVCVHARVRVRVRVLVLVIYQIHFSLNLKGLFTMRNHPFCDPPPPPHPSCI